MACFIPLILFQNRKLYELIEIDFINLFKKFAYINIYIYNLVNYFTTYIYLYFTPSADENNVILSFNYYHQFNLIVYMDIDMHFTN